LISKIVSAFISVNVFFASLFFISLLSPSVYETFIHKAHSDKVFSISVISPEGVALSNGTGFYVENSKGIKYLLTNKHVCQNETNLIKATDSSGNELKTKIIKMSDRYDLCAIEPVDEAGSFRLDDFHLITPHYALGYPADFPMQISSGYVRGRMIYTGFSQNTSKDFCDKIDGEHLISEIEFTMYGSLIKAKKESCKYKYERLQTQIQIRGGSSGSPLINSLGGIVGMIVSRDSLGWGFAIPQSYIVDFIEGI